MGCSPHRRCEETGFVEKFFAIVVGSCQVNVLVREYTTRQHQKRPNLRKDGSPLSQPGYITHSRLNRHTCINWSIIINEIVVSPFMKLGMSIRKRQAAGIIVVSSRLIYPATNSWTWVCYKPAVIDAPWVLIYQNPAIGSSHYSNITLFLEYSVSRV